MVTCDIIIRPDWRKVLDTVISLWMDLDSSYISIVVQACEGFTSDSDTISQRWILLPELQDILLEFLITDTMDTSSLLFDGVCVEWSIFLKEQDERFILKALSCWYRRAVDHLSTDLIKEYIPITHVTGHYSYIAVIMDNLIYLSIIHVFLDLELWSLLYYHLTKWEHGASSKVIN
jgi:hypothetical protein